MNHKDEIFQRQQGEALREILGGTIDRRSPAYLAGRQAFLDGTLPKDNPNPRGSTDEFQWGGGWLEARSSQMQEQAKAMLARLTGMEHLDGL